jgi:hypothetical protein
MGAEPAAGALCAEGAGRGSRERWEVASGVAGGETCGGWALRWGGCGYHGIATPPFGRTIWPVVKDEASEAR